MRRATAPSDKPVLLALCAALGIGLLAGLLGCGGRDAEGSVGVASEGELEPREAPSVSARASAYVEFVDDYLFWGEDEELWVASIARDGGLEELEDAGAFEDDVRQLAALDGVLYVSTDGGIYRMDASDDAEDAERLLDGRGAIRIHGGGFGGSIQCFVPVDMVDAFIAQMNAWLGEGACRHYVISEEGATAAWL